MPQCGRCQADNPGQARFCLNCGAPLTSSAPPRETRKIVTVLFNDVAGSTPLGEKLDPESLRRVMSLYFDAMKRVIERHGGTVEKFIGDAVMAVFGIPTLHEDDALRAVRAALDMRVDLESLNVHLRSQWGVEIQARTGINTGEVVVGDPFAGQSLVIGDPVNVAARLEQAAQPGEILVGQTTLQLVRDAVTIEHVEPLSLKGKSLPVEAVRLLTVTGEMRSQPRKLQSTLVGREKERTLLRQAFERATAESSCHLFTVLGPAGVGKSRLVAEFLRGLDEQAVVLRGRCVAYGEGITYWPLREVVRDAVQAADSEDAEDVRVRVNRLLSDDKDTGWIADRLHQLFGVTEVTAGADELAWAARRFFELLASSAPLIVIFDDIHWAEPTFLDLIEHVADWSRDAPIMLLAIARPELHDARPSWAGGKLNATSIMLEPLGAEDSQRLIANLLGQDEAEPQLAARIIEAAEGNPFFVEEMVSMLIDRGVLQSSEGGWQVPADLSTVSTPPTVQALLAARLDQLTPAKRETAQRAAVIGRVFWRDAVLEMTPVDERPGVGSALMALIRKEVVRPDRSSFQGQDAFRFRHALIRDAAYQALPKESRGDLHERFAHWLEQAAGQRKAEFDEILGYHYEQAYRYRTELGRADVDAVQSARRAAELLEAAGTRAKERADYPAAAKLLNRTVALLPAGSPQRIELLAELAGILYETGDFSEASNVLQQAQEELEEAPDARAEDLVEVQRWTLQLSVEPGAEAEAELAARNAIATFESTGDLGGLAYAYRLLQWILLTNENYTQLAETAQKAIHCSRSAGQHQQADESLNFLLGAVMHGPMKVDDAVRLCATLFDENKHRRVAVPHIQRAQAHLSAMQLEFDKARELLAQSNESLVEQGRVVSSAAGQGVVGTQIEAMAENWAAAEAISRSAWETLVGLGEKGFASTIAAQLAVVLARQGKADAAIEFADAGAELGSPSDIATQATARQGKAEALAIRGDLEIAESLAREAVNLQSATDAIGESGEAYISLAVVLERAGKADKAANAIRQAIELFERKGNLASLANARARLQRLALPA